MGIVMQQEVLGAKKGLGEFEGTKYDYTKVRVRLPASDRSGNEVGFDTVEMIWGTHENFEKIKAVKYPAVFELDVNMTTKGYEIISCKPVQGTQQPKVA